MTRIESRLFQSLFALLVAAVAAPAPGDELPFDLLADIETTGEPLLIPPPITAPPIELPGSNPTQFLTIGDRMFFTADDRTHGAELWVTDGTTAGTELLVDLCPGSCSSSPVVLGILAGDIVFWADDGQHGSEPWITDGTPAGTRLLADVCPGDCDGRLSHVLDWLQAFYPGTAAITGGHLYFVARAPETGREVWLTDGTAAGTRPVTDICPGACDSFDYSAGPLATAGGRVVFLADDGKLGEELWATDGQTTSLVTEFCPGSEGHDGLGFMKSIGDRVILGSSCNLRDGRLWATDGSPAGTEVLAELPGDEDGRAPWIFDLIALERGRALVRLQFFGSSLPNQLWITDGTPAATGPIFDQLPDSFRPMVQFGKRAALIEHGNLWITDGNPGGTRQVAGVTATGDVGAAGSLLLFDATDDFGRQGLFGIDGGGSPELLTTLHTGSGIGFYGDYFESGLLNGFLVIPAYADPEEGAELWITPWRRPELAKDPGLLTRPSPGGEG